ncbi:hypothetical protein LEP1GSC081_4457 [Leptospira kirschneri str. H1]|uniref:Uncharacterized protein n=1 Tax=Leptospira kirschneri str. H1 TaxID=1049966 RepID=A0A0E2B2W5_9LEPT|nr:hypothetical protein LEP1GSC081_4457 [Leptospira kirschneri str. H1]
MAAAPMAMFQSTSSLIRERNNVNIWQKPGLLWVSIHFLFNKRKK